MKRTIIGIVFLFTGVYLFVVIHKVLVDFIPEITSWNTELGQYGQAMINTNSEIPLMISILLFIKGVLILIKEYRGK